MASGKHFRIIIALALVAVVGTASYIFMRSRQTAPLVGVVRGTQIRIAPEVGGQLATIKVRKGDQVRAGDVVAELEALELTASVGQARAALAAAAASRDHVYAGVRDEEIARLEAEISKAKAQLNYMQLQLNRTSVLARGNNASQQALDQAQRDAVSTQADVAEAVANHAAAKAGPTKEQLAIADARVAAAVAALAVLERRLDKMILRAPHDGVVSVVVAEVGEAIRAGEPVLAIDKSNEQWLSFNVREDFLRGLTVGTKVDVASQGAPKKVPTIVTEVRPLGPFATWQAERAIGDHDRNTLRLRIDLVGDRTGFEPGMTVWINP
jgi:HlyD family secretion protein